MSGLLVSGCESLRRSTPQPRNPETWRLAGTLLPAHGVGPETKGRVLVVDDEPAIRALVAKIVERAGHPVDVASDGLEAQQRIDQHHYAVVVLDLMMPHVNGFEFIEHLRQRPGRRPSVIVITAAPELSLSRQLDPQVVHSVIRKPFDISVLADLIAAAAESQNDAASRSDDGDNVLEFHR